VIGRLSSLQRLLAVIGRLPLLAVIGRLSSLDRLLAVGLLLSRVTPSFIRMSSVGTWFLAVKHRYFWLQ
jgi:hypothetical protein